MRTFKMCILYSKLTLVLLGPYIYRFNHVLTLWSLNLPLSSSSATNRELLYSRLVVDGNDLKWVTNKKYTAIFKTALPGFRKLGHLYIFMYLFILLSRSSTVEYVWSSRSALFFLKCLPGETRWFNNDCLTDLRCYLVLKEQKEIWQRL